MSRLRTVMSGDRPPPRSFGPVTQTDIVRFAGAGGDFNPLHHDPEHARAAGFEPPIAMGQLTAGLLAALLTDWCGVENLLSYEVRFTSPVRIGDTVELFGAVTEVATNAAMMELTAAVAGTPVVTARAAVRVLSP